jgi:hypothetical protein
MNNRRVITVHLKSKKKEGSEKNIKKNFEEKVQIEYSPSIVPEKISLYFLLLDLNIF